MRLDQTDLGKPGYADRVIRILYVHVGIIWLIASLAARSSSAGDSSFPLLLLPAILYCLLATGLVILIGYIWPENHPLRSLVALVAHAPPLALGLLVIAGALAG